MEPFFWSTTSSIIVFKRLRNSAGSIGNDISNDKVADVVEDKNWKIDEDTGREEG